MNWFEGGRRITKIFMVIAALIGAYNSCFEFSRPALEFSTRSPRDDWSPSLMTQGSGAPANTPLQCADSEYLPDFAIKPDLVRNVYLCFLSNNDGKIIYYSSKEEEERMKKVEIAINRAKSSGELEEARLLSKEALQIRDRLNKEGPYEWFGNAFSDLFQYRLSGQD